MGSDDRLCECESVSLCLRERSHACHTFLIWNVVAFPLILVFVWCSNSLARGVHRIAEWARGVGPSEDITRVDDRPSDVDGGGGPGPRGAEVEGEAAGASQPQQASPLSGVSFLLLFIIWVLGRKPTRFYQSLQSISNHII